MTRTWFRLALVALIGLALPVAGTAQEKDAPRPTKPDADKKAAELAFVFPDDTSDVVQGNNIVLMQELARQAFLLTLREEFHLRTRDALLGDAAPEGLPPKQSFCLRYDRLKDGLIKVAQGSPDKSEEIWSGKLNTANFYGYKPETVVAEVEELSRREFVKAVEKTGLKAQANAKGKAEVPESAEARLRQLTEPAQFGALRELHAAMRADGESPALVGGLVRAYANLGLLMEYSWNMAPKSFKARALLYAQRLINQAPDSPWGYWHRAYAAAFVGMHHLALADLEAANNRAKDQKAPTWVGLIDAFVHFDHKHLEAATKNPNKELSRLLLFLALEDIKSPAWSIRAGRSLLEDIPECYRVHDSLSQTGGVSNLHGATIAPLKIFTEELDRRVREQPDLPKSVAALLDKEGGNEPEIYKALKEAGAHDDGEPSWTVLARVLQEVRFRQFFHRANFMSNMWGVEADDFVAVAVPLLEGHPFVGVIESFTLDPRRQRDAFLKKLLAVPERQFDTAQYGLFKEVWKVDPSQYQQIYARARMRVSSTYFDELSRLRHTSEGEVVLPGYASFLRKISPHSPLGKAAVIEYREREEEVIKSLPAYEKDSGWHPAVLRALGKRYLAMKRDDDALKCWKRSIELSPDSDLYRSLAGLYKAKGDIAAWQETLEAYLKEEDTGLGHAQVRVELARHFMDKKDYKTALPYAEAAGESYAEWAMLCAAECQEGLEDWDAANKWYRQAAERYSGSCFRWYFFVKSVDHADELAAEKLTARFVRALGEPVPLRYCRDVARYHLLTAQWDRAVQPLEQLNAGDQPGLWSHWVALAADSAGETKARDRALSQPLKDDKNQTALVKLFQDCLAKGEKAKLDLEAVDALLKGQDAATQANYAFYVGWFCHNRGQDKEATDYLKRCTESKEGIRWVRTHATNMLGNLAK